MNTAHDDTRTPADSPSTPTASSLPGLPTPGRLYTDTLQVPSFRWWKPVVSTVTVIVGFLVLSVAMFGLAAIAQDLVIPGAGHADAGPGASPLTFAASALSLTTLIPLTWFVVRVVHGQPFGWTLSVTGRPRWGWLARAVAALLALFAVTTTAFALAQGIPAAGDRDPQWFWYAAVAVCIMPFQSAAEEVFFRGYLHRAVAAYFIDTRLGFTVGVVLSALLFMAAHGAGDPWLNAYYLLFGITLSVAARLTGGLEAPIAIHAVNNLTAGLAGALTQDMSHAFDRSAGTGGPFLLIQLALVAAAAAFLVLWARRSGLQTHVGA